MSRQRVETECHRLTSCRYYPIRPNRKKPTMGFINSDVIGGFDMLGSLWHAAILAVGSARRSAAVSSFGSDQSTPASATSQIARVFQLV